MPKEWRGTLYGARKLGLVRILGDEVTLTQIGAAVKVLLPATMVESAQVHAMVGARGSAVPLADYRPQYAAALRLLLLHDPFVRLVIQGLETFHNQSANFRELAMACDRLDHARALAYFLQPESLPQLMDNKGRINWNESKGEHYRSRTFYQYKSILKHAGILSPGRLGGDSAIGYQPESDTWTLR